MAKAVHSTMSAFTHPASRSFTRLLGQFSGFFTTRPNVRRKPKRLCRGWRWTFNHDTLDNFASQFYITPVRFLNGQAYRHTISCGQQTAFQSTLSKTVRVHLHRQQRLQYRPQFFARPKTCARFVTGISPASVFGFTLLCCHIPSNRWLKSYSDNQSK
jgi:hypothetical protein